MPLSLPCLFVNLKLTCSLAFICHNRYGFLSDDASDEDVASTSRGRALTSAIPSGNGELPTIVSFQLNSTFSLLAIL